MKQRIRLDSLTPEQRAELEQKYVHYVPDNGKVIYSKICQQEQHLETLPVPGGWHLVFPEGYPRLISHDTISFNALPIGINGWMYHEEENLKFLSSCYSSRALGAEGGYFTAEEYEKLSSWIKNTCYKCNVFLGNKVRNGIFYDIAVACGSEIQYIHVADTAGNTYHVRYSFRPVVELYGSMYLIIDDDDDGSTPEKGMLLEPDDNYDPFKHFSLPFDIEQELTATELLDTLREFVKSPLYAKLKPLLDSLEKE